jgi:ankyrin repeat protein
MLTQYPDSSMLLVAVDSGYLNICKFLVEEVEVDINRITRGGETAMHRACYRNRPEIIRYLISKGADIE